MPKPVVVVHNVVLYVLLAVMLIAGAIYYQEDSEELSETLRYYGNVTAKAKFEYPEKIELITFGWQKEETIDVVEFVNELWCAPIGTAKAKELVKIRYKKFEDFRFVNELPEDVLAVVEEEIIPTHQISLIARRSIRAQHKKVPYGTWNMDDIRPLESSDCHITAKLVTYTDRFGIKKTYDFIGHEFQYVIPDDLKEKI